MAKFKIAGSMLFFILNIFSISFADNLTITTYYPSPYGSYNELSAKRMKIGNTYSSFPMSNSDNGKLIVEGRVGIGTTNPDRLLHLSSAGIASGLWSTGIKIENTDAGGRAYSLVSTNNGAGLGGGKFAIISDSDATVPLSIDSSGDVAIGVWPANAGAKLDVNGQIKVQGGTLGAGNVLTDVDGSGVASWQPVGGIPSGAVMSFNLPSCPAGWTEFTPSRGRYVVGLPSGGTLAGIKGTQLTDLEDRTVGAHHHDIVQVGGGTAHGACPTIETSVYVECPGRTDTSTTGSVAGTNAPYIQLLMCQKD